MTILNKNKKNKGFSSLITIFLLLGVISAIMISWGAIALSDIRHIRDMVNSAKAYYFAEGVLEDAVYRIKSTSYSDPSGTYTVNFNEGSVGMSIITPPLDNDSREIIATATSSSRVRKEEVILSINTIEQAFFYAIQAGNGHFYLDNNASVTGNIYSNGDIIGVNKINSVITNDAIAVGEISDVTIQGDAKANSLDNCVVLGDATYTESINDCSVSGSTYNESEPPPEAPFPNIDIAFWKNEAGDGGPLPSGGGSYTPPNGDRIGPNKIDGNLTIDGGRTVYLEGTIWVTGNLTIKTNAILKLVSGYEGRSGIIIVDGKIILENGGKVQGSGTTGSYLLLISLDTSLLYTNPAIEISNNSDSGVFYAPNGMIVVANRADVREVTGKGIHVNENSDIIYESGLESVEFTSGPGGSWEITKWNEIEPGE